MVTFNDLEFKEKPAFTDGGIYARIFFPNGYGASVIAGGCAYANAGQYELAVLKGDKDKWELCYSTPITKDVVGYNSPEDITELLQKIESLPPAA